MTSLDELAAELSRVSGRLVTYQRETLEEARASRAGFGAPAWEIEGWVTSYAAIATGELAAVTDVVAHLTGHPPRDLTDFLAAHPESYRHLVAGTPSATLEG
jgi:NAD(P)H dehydrogenase (quinone)